MKNKWAAILIPLVAMLAMPLAHAEGEVARSIITTEVVDREPVNDLEMVPNTEDTVLFFTELRNMEGQTVKHVWMRGDEQMAEVSFEVGGPRWRIWSSKNMMPEWSGSWTVQVVNGVGGVLAEKTFTYGMAEDTGMGMATEGQEPMTEEAPMVEEAPMTEGAPMTEQAPMTESAPMTEEAPMSEGAPAAEEKGGAGMAE